MKAVKIMSIIGIVFFPLCLILVVAFSETDVEASLGWGVFSTFYGLGFSITACVIASKQLKLMSPR